MKDGEMASEGAKESETLEQKGGANVTKGRTETLHRFIN